MLDYQRQAEDAYPQFSDLSRGILVAVAAAGTLDILSAFFFAGLGGANPGQVLRYVASGPFGDSMHAGGLAAAILGLAVHYALMAIIVTVFFLIASRIELVRRQWLLTGVLYGILIYLVMNWVVVPTRFGKAPGTDLWSVGNALFSHIVCVGLPAAFIASRTIKSSDSSQIGLEPVAPEIL